MARAKKELPADDPVAEEESAPTKDDYTINDTVLLEKIPELRFVDKNGLVYRLDVVPWVANGDYRLVRA